MIHDAKIEVTCDGNAGMCRSNEFYEPPYVYSTYSGKDGRYDDDDKKIETWLVDECSWIVRDGKHYCCEECADGKNG